MIMTDEYKTVQLTDEELKKVNGGFGESIDSNLCEGDFCEFINNGPCIIEPTSYTSGTDIVYKINYIYEDKANLICYEGKWESVGIMKEYISTNNYLYGDVKLYELKKVDKPKWV